MKRVLVIGASGLLGSAIYQLACDRGYETVGTTTRGTESLAPYDLMTDRPDKLANFVSLDEETSVVVAAGKTEISWCATHERIARAINVTAMQQLITYLINLGCHVLYFSSDAVFDGKEGNYTEMSVLSPLNIYGKQKAEMETWLTQERPQVLIYRLAKLVKAVPQGRHLFADLYRGYQADGGIKCIEGLTFNPTAVDDVAECALLGLQRKLTGLYNVSNSEIFTREQIARLFLKGHDAFVECCPLSEWNFKEPKALNTTLDTRKFQTDVNYTFTSMSLLVTRFWQCEAVVIG